MGCEINVYAHSEDLLYPNDKKKLITKGRTGHCAAVRTHGGAGNAHVEVHQAAQEGIGGERRRLLRLGPFTLAARSWNERPVEAVLQKPER